MTAGQMLNNLRVSTAAAALGLLLVIVGSFAPWVTTPLGSASGINGDGKISLAVGVVAFGWLVFMRGRGWFPVAVLGGLSAALGAYEAYHIHHKVAAVTLFGHQLAHVGWGVYAVLGGGALVLIGAVIATVESREEI